MALSCSKILLLLLYGIALKHKNVFYCLDRPYSFRKKLILMKKYPKIKAFVELWCYDKMIILEFKKYMKLDKMPYITYADIKSLI